MEIKELMEMINNSVDKLVDEHCFKRVLNMRNCLLNFDVVNRILIELQNSKAYDLRTIEDWEINGREVKRNAKPIILLYPRYVTKYWDKEKECFTDIPDMNSSEIKKAVEYGLIERRKEIGTMDKVQVYDIASTVQRDGYEKYKISKPKLGIPEILKLFKEITGASLEKLEQGDESYYSISSNTAFISGGNYEHIAKTVAGFIVSYLDSRISDVIEVDELDDNERLLVKISVEYAIKTLFAIEDSDIDFSVLSQIDKNAVLDILGIVYTLLETVTDKISFENNINNSCSLNKIEKIRKSEKLLNAINAHSIYRRITS